MSFRGNGNRRDPKFLLGSILIMIICILTVLIAARNDWKFSWLIISAALFFLSIIMFKNANEQ